MVTPESPRELARLVRWARRTGTGLVARGGATSLSEGVTAPAGSTIVDLSGLDRIGPIDTRRRTVVVGPGVVGWRLHRALAKRGLFLPPNPGSWRRSTVGGWVATNASGPRSFGYGPTRRWLRGVEAVLGTGELLRAGTSARKRSAGPEWVALLAGSEGSLAIFTRLVFDLAPLPALRVGLAIPVGSDRQASRLGEALASGRVDGLSAVEYVDGLAAEGLAEELPASARGQALVLLEVEASCARERQDRIARIRAVAARVSVAGPVAEFPDADRLWTVRGESGDRLDRLLGPRLREDVAVPLDRLEGLFAVIRWLGRRYGVRVHVYGHLGEGNLHPNFAVDPASRRAAALRRALLVEVHRLGGTVSAEHGLGRTKRAFFALEHDRTSRRLWRALKAACDPDGVLNPGVLSPLR